MCSKARKQECIDLCEWIVGKGCRRLETDTVESQKKKRAQEKPKRVSKKNLPYNLDDLDIKFELSIGMFSFAGNDYVGMKMRNGIIQKTLHQPVRYRDYRMNLYKLLKSELVHLASAMNLKNIKDYKSKEEQIVYILPYVPKEIWDATIVK